MRELILKRINKLVREKEDILYLLDKSSYIDIPYYESRLTIVNTIISELYDLLDEVNDYDTKTN